MNSLNGISSPNFLLYYSFSLNFYLQASFCDIPKLSNCVFHLGFFC